MSGKWNYVWRHQVAQAKARETPESMTRCRGGNSPAV